MAKKKTTSSRVKTAAPKTAAPKTSGKGPSRKGKWSKLAQWAEEAVTALDQQDLKQAKELLKTIRSETDGMG